MQRKRGGRIEKEESRRGVREDRRKGEVEAGSEMRGIREEVEERGEKVC